MTSCCNMADGHEWFGIVFSSLLFAFGVGLQCPSTSYFKVAVDDSVVINDTASSVPISDVQFHLTCLYYSGEPCSTNSANLIYWDHHGGDNNYCLDVVVNGEEKRMYAANLSVSVLSPRDTVHCNNPEGVAKDVFISPGGRLSQDQCFCMPQAQTCTTASPSPSTTSSSPPSSDSPTSSYDQSFNGINPLIYTVTAVALLGTASIVAMVSCCIRQRRAMLRRREFLFGRDYLDFMNDRDFTQLTANQLAASLHEAPPTYQQSEEIERQLKDTEDDEDTPPPLPPRNMPRNSNTTEVEPIPSDHSEDENDTQDILRNLI